MLQRVIKYCLRSVSLCVFNQIYQLSMFVSISKYVYS